MKTGFKELDKVMKLKNGELTIIASRPAMGKSTLVKNILNNVCIKENKAVLYFSFEESKETIIKHLLVKNSMIERDKIEALNNCIENKNNIVRIKEDKEKILYAVNLLKDAPILIESDIPYTTDEIINKSIKMKKEQNIELIIIDYLQLIDFDKSRLLSREDEIKEILKQLKELAKQLNIPIIITSQISSQPDRREDKRPLLTDFTNSKDVMTYCDNILFIYRDSYYNNKNKSNLTDIIIAKNTNGNEDTIKLVWMPKYCMFGNTTIIEKTKK